MRQLWRHRAEREAEDADGARDVEAEGPGRGVRDGAEGVEGAAQAQETGNNNKALNDFQGYGYVQYKGPFTNDVS